MTPERLEQVRKAWQSLRGRFDWYRLPVAYIVVPANDNGDWYPTVSVPKPEELIDKVRITAEACGYVTDDGDVYEWWNIICDGHIIDAERYDSPIQSYRARNQF